MIIKLQHKTRFQKNLEVPTDSKFATTSVTFKYTINSILVLNALIAKLDERHEKNRGSCWVEGKR